METFFFYLPWNWETFGFNGSVMKLFLRHKPILLFIINEHEKKWHCAPSEDSAQSAHLIRVFVLCSMGCPRPKMSSCEQQRLLSDCADSYAGMSLRWAHIAFCMFCRALAQTDFPIAHIQGMPSHPSLRSTAICFYLPYIGLNQMTILSVELWYTFEFQLQAQESNKKPYRRKAYEKYVDHCLEMFLIIMIKLILTKRYNTNYKFGEKI